MHYQYGRCPCTTPDEGAPGILCRQSRAFYDHPVIRKELGPEVRVNGVAPGAILWPDNEMPDHTKQLILERTALKRPGEPMDIAKTILFLVRDAQYITGQIIAVDGGRTLNI